MALGMLSKRHVFGSLAKLLCRPRDVPLGGIQVLMAHQRSEANEVVLIRRQEFPAEAVAQQMGMDSHTDNRAVFREEISNALSGQRTTLADEKVRMSRRASAFEVFTDGPPHWQRQGYLTRFVALGVSDLGDP